MTMAESGARVQRMEEEKEKGLTPVAFDAQFKKGIAASMVRGEMMAFPDIRRNNGGGLSENGDVFVVPVRGTYAFSLTVIHTPRYMSNVPLATARLFGLKVNGVSISQSVDDFSPDIASTMLKLDKGSRVTVWCVGRMSLVNCDDDFNLTFTGTLLHES